MFMTGRYVRPAPKELVGETAMLMWKSPSKKVVLAQFDNLRLFNRHETDWAFGWHEFTPDSFQITENET